MSNSVDQKIVQMQFDNVQFEKGVAVTMGSLKKLSQELQLKEGMTGIQGIDAAVSKMDFGSVSTALDELNDKFSILGVVGATAISRITNNLMDIGGQVLKGITIDPLVDGLTEYNLKLDSIKTIQTNTLGKSSFEEITAVLEELNEYADQTIYSFSDMTYNIGTFTAAGVDLNTAAAAIKGISNLAAASGVNATKAANAMYQMSQALSVGKMMAIDWRSMEVAGIGSQMFRDNLIQTAEVMHIGARAAIEANGSFRDSLKEGWLTNDVLMQTLENFTLLGTEEERIHLREVGYNDEMIDKIFEQARAANAAATQVKSFNQLIDTTREALGTGWATTWEYIIGDITQAQRLWTDVSQGMNALIGSLDKVRNDFFRAWNKGQILDKDGILKQVEGVESGWEAMFEALKNIAGLIEDIVRPIAEAFEAVFQLGSGAEQAGIAAARASMSFRDFAVNLRTSFETSATGQAIVMGLKGIFTALFSVIKAVTTILGGAFSVAFKAVTIVIEAAANVIEFFVSGIRDLIGFVGSIDLSFVFDPIKEFFTSTFNVPELRSIVGILEQLFGVFFNFITGTKGLVGDMRDSFNNLHLEYLQNLLQSNFAKLVEKAGTALGEFAVGVGKVAAVGAQTIFEGLGEALSGFQYLWNQAQPAFENLQKFFENVWTKIVDSVSSIDLSPIMDFAASNIVPFLKDLAKAIGLVAGSIALIAGFTVIEGLIWVFEKLQQAWNFVQPVFEGIKEKVTGAWNVIREAFMNADFSIEPFKEMFVKFGDAFSKFISEITENGFSFEALAGLFGSLRDAVVDLFNDIAPAIETFTSLLGDNLDGSLKAFLDIVGQLPGPLELLRSAMQAVNDVFTSFKDFRFPWDTPESGVVADTAVQSLTDISTVITTASNVVTMIKNPMKTVSSFISSGLNGFLAGVDEFVKQLDTAKIEEFVSRIMQLGAMGGVVAGLYEFFMTLHSIRNFLDAVTGIPKAISGIGTAMTGAINQFKESMKVATVTQIAISIAILVGALFLLSMIDYERLQQVTPYLIGIAAAVVGAMVLFSKLSMVPTFNINAISAFAGAMTSLAIGVAALAGLVALLGLLPQEAVVRGIATVSFLVGLIVVLGVLGNKMKGSFVAAKSMQEYAKVLVELGLIVALLSVIPPSQALVAVGILTILSLLMVGLAKVMSTIQGINFTASLTGLGGIALVILALAGAIAVLSILPTDKMLISMIGLTGMLIALMVVLDYLTLISEQGPMLAQAALVFLILAGAVAILSVAVGALAVIGAIGGDLVTATEAVLVLVLGMALVASVLAEAGPTMIGATAALLNFAIVVAVMSAVIIAFSLMDTNSMWTAVFQFTVALGVLVGALALIGLIGDAFGEGLKKVGEFAWLIGVSAAAFGAAVLAIAVSMAILAAVGPEAATAFIASLQILGQGIWDSQASIAAGIAGLVLGILAGLAMCIPGAIVIFMQLIGAIIGALVASGPIIGQAAVLMVAGILNGFADGLDAYGPLLMEALMHLGEVIINGVLGILSDGVNSFNNWLYDVTGGLMGVAPKAHEAGEEFGTQYAEGVKSTNDQVDSAVNLLGGTVNDGLTDVNGYLSQAQSAFGIDITSLTNADNLTQNVPEEIRSMMSEYGLEGMNLSDAFYDGAEQEAEARGGLLDTIVNAQGGFEASITSLQDQMQPMGAAVIDTFDNAIGAAAVNSNSGAILASAIDTDVATENVTAAVGSVAEASNATFASLFKLDVQPGVDQAVATVQASQGSFNQAALLATMGAVTGAGSGISGFTPAVSAGVGTAVSAVSSISGSMYSAAYGVGQQACNGLINGINSLRSSVISTASSMANSVASALSNALQVQSPSRVTMRIGEYVGEGLAIGIRNSTSIATNASKKLGLETTKSILAQAAKVAEAVEDMDYSPTITPVLDTSRIEAGVSDVTSLLSGTNAVMAANISGIAGSFSARQQDAQTQPAQSTTYVLQIDGLTIADDQYTRGLVVDLIDDLRGKAAMNFG